MPNEFDKTSTLDNIIDVKEFIEKEVKAWTTTHNIEDLKKIEVSETRTGKGIKSSRNNGIIHIEVPSNKLVEAQKAVRIIEQRIHEMIVEKMLEERHKQYKQSNLNRNTNRRRNHSRKKRETLFSRFKKFIKRNWLRISTVAIGVGATAAIGQALTSEENEPTNNSQPTTKITQETTKNPRDEFVAMLQTGEVIEIPSTVDCKSIEEVKQHFIKTYIEKYNEKFGTNYIQYEADMYVNSLEEGKVYEVDGKQVTRGSKPEQTKQELEKLGSVEMVELDGRTDKVVQVVVDGKILGTYNVETGKFIYSGNQLEDIQDTDFEAPELENIGIDSNLAKRASEVLQAEDVESKTSIQARINLYNKTIYDNYDNKEKGFEPGD